MRRLSEKAGLALLHKLNPELAHNASLALLKSGFVPMPGQRDLSILKTQVGQLQLVNPIGLAAGFDKNAIALHALTRAGFGFVEVGAVTPLAQYGNSRPRLFRLPEDRAIINRMGFNNDGMAVVKNRLKVRPRNSVIGLNLGTNKDGVSKVDDFLCVLAVCGSDVDFVTVNVSSPNTRGLRDLQQPDALSALLATVRKRRTELALKVPIFLKIAPDLNTDQLESIASLAEKYDVSAIIATNTTTARDALKNHQRNQVGGLSGQPLFEQSTRILALLSSITDLPLIGVGGIASAEQAYAKIRAGASAIQLYTGLVYEGFSLVDKLAHGLADLLQKNGFESVAEAVGTGKYEWL